MTTRDEYERRRMAVANHILEHPEKFDMNTWGYETSCGTVACLAGTAALLAAKEGLCKLRWSPFIGPEANVMNLKSVKIPAADGRFVRQRGISEFSGNYLGLSARSSLNLFHSYELTPEQAAKRLLEEPYVEEGTE